MGFPGRRTLVLEFEGPMEGAEVTVRAASTETMLALREMTTHEAVPLLAAHLVSWNLVDSQGEPIPHAEEPIRREVELGVLKQITQAWYEVAVGITAPLDKPSSDGPPSPTTDKEAPSIPMEPL